MLRDYNKRREDFATARDYDDYLEEVQCNRLVGSIKSINEGNRPWNRSIERKRVSWRFQIDFLMRDADGRRRSCVQV